MSYMMLYRYLRLAQVNATLEVVFDERSFATTTGHNLGLDDNLLGVCFESCV